MGTPPPWPLPRPPSTTPEVSSIPLPVLPMLLLSTPPDLLSATPTVLSSPPTPLTLSPPGLPTLLPEVLSTLWLPFPTPTHHGLVAHPNGAVVPAEPADVVAARQAHLAALASA